MPRAPTQKGDIKVLPEPHEKAAFIEGSRRARQSLSAWMIQAGVERAERQGIVVADPVLKKKGTK
ncbi:MAG TPA: hypothetical protein VHG72_13930 [Polyangia bacterium]|nr:hypothetical protein [Polyangia bacterium]